MSKNRNQNNVTEAAVAVIAAPEAPQVETTKPETSQPKLSAKAQLILSLLADGPLTRKGLVEKAAAQGKKLSSPDTTAYIGSVKEDIRTKWDAVALDPSVKVWNHVSLIGLNLVSYDAMTKTFRLTGK